MLFYKKNYLYVKEVTKGTLLVQRILRVFILHSSTRMLEGNNEKDDKNDGTLEDRHHIRDEERNDFVDDKLVHNKVEQGYGRSNSVVESYKDGGNNHHERDDGNHDN